MNGKQKENEPEISPFSVEARQQTGRELVKHLELAEIDGVVSENEHEHYVKQKLDISGTHNPEVLK